jgi:hypothetical protein
MSKIGTLIGIQCGCSHDHAGRAEAALECLGTHKGLLHRVQVAVLRQAFDRGHFASGGTEGRYQTGMHRLSIEPNGAGAAIPGVASLLNAKAAVLTQEGTQALAWARLGFEPVMIDAKGERPRGLVGPWSDVVHELAPDCVSSA